MSADDDPAEAPPPVLVAEDLLATGSRGVVFGPVSLSVAPGEVVALVGAGATGRTSLLLALAGRFAVAGGRLSVAGDVAIARAGNLLELDEVWTVGEAIAQRALLSRRPPALVADLPSALPLHALTPLQRALLDVALAASEGRAVIVMDDVDRGLTPEDEAHVWAALVASGAAAVGVTTDAGSARAAGATIVSLTRAHA
ncbi:ATP-binding cassette domain-containing protein [Baekduia sp. Peel2402]|uniref:ATP-binding cassette domain-containing protein n=1 Tax=Baekduia sp. Peel2402 TaxID=3458296 RepID=UPI00403E3B9E